MGFWMGSQGSMGFLLWDRETVLGPDLVRIHCWLDVFAVFLLRIFILFGGGCLKR